MSPQMYWNLGDTTERWLGKKNANLISEQIRQWVHWYRFGLFGGSSSWSERVCLRSVLQALDFCFHWISVSRVQQICSCLSPWSAILSYPRNDCTRQGTMDWNHKCKYILPALSYVRHFMQWKKLTYYLLG